MKSPRPPASRHLALAVLGAVALLANCSARSDYAGSDDGVPHWIREGVRLASAEKDERSGPAVDDEATDGEAPPTTSVTGLPSREVVVASLTAGGLTPEQAECMYDKVSADPQVSVEVTAFLTALSTPGGAGATGAVAGLSSEATTRLVTTVSPCLDQATLVGLLAAGQGTGGNTQLQSLLNSAQGLNLASLAGFDPAALAQSIAGRLGAEQVRKLQELLAAVGSAPGGGGSLAAIDLEGLDVSKLKPEETPLLILALLRGLTPAQQAQLLSLTNIDLGDIDLQVNPDTLTPEEVGRLLLALSPVLAGTISPKPPDGQDPGQVYVPPGADLSNINPLIFLNRNDVIAALQKQGMTAPVAACLFDSLARLPPQTIAALFTSDAQQSSAVLVALSSVRCIAGG